MQDQASADANNRDSATTNVDVLVVGFGKAGKTIAGARAKAGDKVALVEQSPEMFGGTCINIGCVPTKTLLTSAQRFAEAQNSLSAAQAADSAESGAELTADGAFDRAREHRNTFIAKLNSVNEKIARDAGAMVITGRARFTGERTVEVTAGSEKLTVTAETVIINTGAVAVIPPIPGADNPAVVDSTSIQQLPQRPQRLVIVGGGPIGLEFATMFSQFGSDVTVLDGAPQFLGRFDRDIADAVAKNLDAQDIKVVSGAQVKSISGEGEVQVTYSLNGNDGNEESVAADNVLLATGRKPATEDLGLESAGVSVNDRGAVVVDEHLRTSADGVYAAGDVTGGPQFTYVSFDDHRVILSDRWGDGSRVTTDRVIPNTTFIQPPLSQVGLGEDAAREYASDKGHNLDVRVKDIADIPIMPRPKILGQPEGLAKFLVDTDDDRILGATLYCIDSQELINLVTLAITQNVPASAVGSGIYTHPSSSEVFNALLS